MRFNTYQPVWAPIRQFQRELDRVWDNSQDGTNNTAAWAPVVDVTENGSEWLLIAEIPGVSSENIDITANNGYLVIQGEKPGLAKNVESSEEGDTNDQEAGTQHRQERTIGRFYRRFSLPKEADTQKITASSKDGLLTVSIPKQPELQPQRIEIKTA